MKNKFPPTTSCYSECSEISDQNQDGVNNYLNETEYYGTALARIKIFCIS